MSSFNVTNDDGKRVDSANPKGAQADSNAGVARALRFHAASQQIDVSDVEITFDGTTGIVTLSGSVPYASTKNNLISAIGNVAGVAAIDSDNLDVSGP
ncbi:BON domain-containing protein [Nocardia sp. NPDC052001]|uniref:BON domain-containing protein n=1 Tax=Nocardia sp. NPDC052001 TaxID=3154853 RepID=UPI00341F8B72